MLAEVVQKRYEEIFEMAQAELRRSGYEELVAAGIVLTGGGREDGRRGRARGRDVPHAGARRHAAVRHGPVGRRRQPIHATGVGLLLYGSQQSGAARPAAPATDEASLRCSDRFKRWFSGEF